MEAQTVVWILLVVYAVMNLLKVVLPLLAAAFLVYFTISCFRRRA